MSPEGGTVLRELHDPVILDIATSVKIDELESGAAPDKLVEGLVTNVDTALHTGTMYSTLQWTIYSVQCTVHCNGQCTMDI